MLLESSKIYLRRITMNRKLDVAIFGVLPSVDLALLDSGRSVRRPAAKPQPQALVKARTTTLPVICRLGYLSHLMEITPRPCRGGMCKCNTMGHRASIPQLPLDEVQPATRVYCHSVAHLLAVAAPSVGHEVRFDSSVAVLGTSCVLKSAPRHLPANIERSGNDQFQSGLGSTLNCDTDVR